MSRAFKFSRAVAPALLAGGSLCAAALGTTIPGSPPRIAPPCSPDGACLPRYETWGWYETRWRSFPGDVATETPTAADQTPTGPDGRPLPTIGGPQPPDPGQETRIGPDRARGRAGEGATPSPTLPLGEGAPTPSGVLPPVGDPGAVLPPAGPLTPDTEPLPDVGPGGALPGTQGTPPGGATLPGTTPPVTTPEIDPFGAVPAPPAWMAGQGRVAPLPAAAAIPAAQVVAPAVQDGPNLHGDDAPPSLPLGLQDLLGSLPAIQTGDGPMSMAVALQQPHSVRQSPAAVLTGRSVIQASAQTPLGIQLINPASAVAAEVGDGGLQQAIYFEASDQPQSEAAPLPPVNN
jgi:hypothetical protein